MAIRGIAAVLGSVARAVRTSVDVPNGATVAGLDAAIDAALSKRFKKKKKSTSILDTELQLELFKDLDKPVENISLDVSKYVRDLKFELLVPGQHYSGVSNQDLLNILEWQGRPFAEDTPELRDYASKKLLAYFSDKPWDDDSAGEVAQDAIKDWIIARLEKQGQDVTLKPLTSYYAAYKRAAGFDPRIGVKKGKWYAALRKSRVRIDF